MSVPQTPPAPQGDQMPAAQPGAGADDAKAQERRDHERRADARRNKPSKSGARGPLVKPVVSDAARDAFIRGANPATSQVEPPLDTKAPEQPAPTLAPAAPAVATKPANQFKRSVEKTANSAPGSEPRPPWADAHPMVKKNVQVRMSDELRQKLNYLALHCVPHRSAHQIMLDAIEAEADKLIDQVYYKKPGKDKQ